MSTVLDRHVDLVAVPEPAPAMMHYCCGFPPNATYCGTNPPNTEVVLDYAEADCNVCADIERNAITCPICGTDCWEDF